MILEQIASIVIEITLSAGLGAAITDAIAPAVLWGWTGFKFPVVTPVAATTIPPGQASQTDNLHHHQ